MRVFKFKKRATRVSWHKVEQGELFNKLAWLPFYDEVKFNKNTLVFKR